MASEANLISSSAAVDPLTSTRLHHSSTAMAASSLLWVNAFSGLGKLTVAKILTDLLSKEEMILADNEQLIDSAGAKLSRDRPNYQNDRWLQRIAASMEYVFNPITSSKIIVFAGEISLADLFVLCSLWN
ncbi:hypothetical protein ACMFMG_009577 [Clarireedia jacksonii]